MKNKTPLYFGAVFLVLVAIFLATSMNPREKTKGAEPLFPGDRPDIDHIETISPTIGKIVIKRVSGVWQITEPLEYNVALKTMELTLNSLYNIVNDGVVSERAESHAQYELDDASGIAFKAYSGDELIVDVIVGKSSTDFNHTYVREADSDEVFLWRGMFSSVVKRSLNDWRDKGLYSYNPADVVEVTAESKGLKRTLSLPDSVWTFRDNGKEMPVDQQKVSAYINLIASLRCDAFADEKDIPRASQSSPDTKVTFKVRNGDTETFEIWSPGEQDAGRYLVRTEEGGEVFRFYRYRGEQLAINYEKLMPGESGD